MVEQLAKVAGFASELDRQNNQTAKSTAYFDTAALREQLKLLQHLTSFGDLLILVSGIAGVGKSALIQHLFAHEGDQYHLVEVYPQRGLNLLQFSQQIARQLGIEYAAGSTQDLINALAQRLRADFDKRTVMVVDDAMQLDKSALDLVVSLQQRFAGSLSIILVGLPELFEKISLSANIEQIQMYKMQIEPFNLGDSRAYLEHYRKEARMTHFPLNKKGLKALYQASAGVAKQIQNFRLTGKTKTKASKALWLTQRLRSIGLLRWMLALASAVILSLMLSYQDQLNQLLEPVSKTSLEKKPAKQQAAESVEIPAEPKILLDLNAPSPLVKLERQLFLMAQTDTQSQAEASNQPEVNIQPLKGEDWLRSRTPSHYTIQLSAAGDQEAIEHFARQHNLDRQSYIRLLNSAGKPWYIAILGDYPSRLVANRAMEELPIALKNLAPWVRNFAGIQQALDSAKDDAAEK